VHIIQQDLYLQTGVVLKCKANNNKNNNNNTNIYFNLTQLFIRCFLLQQIFVLTKQSSNITCGPAQN